MKTLLTTLFLGMGLLITLISCASDTTNDDHLNNADATAIYNYKADELELLNSINQYRVSSELNSLQRIDYLSIKAQQHNNYMIGNGVMSHDNFGQRVANIKQVLNALTVGENLAYNYSTPQAALNAWLQSPGHKENIEGDYTHFGISITQDAQGRKYYTNIFIRK